MSAGRPHPGVPAAPLTGAVARNRPRITLVTPTFNAARFLEVAIRSVVEQGYDDLEYLVADGRSTDGTMDIVRRYERALAGWWSEPDLGQADAINRGFARATGQVLGWVNADDLLEPGALEALAAAFRPGLVIYAGPVLNFSGDSVPQRLVRQGGLEFGRLVRFWEVHSWHQPGIFYNRETWDAFGPLDEGLRFTMDYDFLLRALPRAIVVHLDRPLARFRLHPTQKTWALELEHFEEKSRVSERYWGGRAPVYRRARDQYLARVFTSCAGLAALRGEARKAARLLSRALAADPWATLADLPGKVLTAPWRLARRIFGNPLARER